MNNDLISREDLKEVLKECAYSYDGVNTWIMKDEVLGIINNVPTVKVPEDTVNCVLTMFGECSYNETGCSDCEIKDKIRKALHEIPDNYCPNCGADMRSGQNNKCNVSYLHQDSITKTDTKI